MADLPKFIARLVVRRPAFLVAAALILVAASTWVLASRQSFDTDILNLLPAEQSAVQGLKITNREFTQARELTFVIHAPGNPEAVSDFHAFLSDRLRTQPWVLRLLDNSPLETASGQAGLPDFALPLLLNLPAAEFHSALALLDPSAISERLARLRRQLDAGSPAGTMELAGDPLGLITAASRPLWRTSALNDTLDVASPDGATRIVSVITRQPTLDAADCRALMAEVRAFLDGTLATFGADTPAVGVTGRSAYVDEISRSMRRDITLTSAVSLLAVTGLFWIAFRRLLPLLGVTLLLAFSALLSLACGTLIFSQLNVIAIGFCSILFGLGDDFGLLLYEGYLSARRRGVERESAIAASIREMAPGILWVALTTAIGFLALSLSGSTGFSQLGAMVAIGVFICATLVFAFLFLFIRDPKSRPPPRVSSPPPLRVPASPLLPFFSLLLLALALLAFTPFRPLSFDTSPHSLEPRHTPAAVALQTIMGAFPASFEPLMIVIPASSAREAAERIAKLEATLEEMRSAGMIASYASPSALVLDPDTLRANAASMAPGQVEAARNALAAGLAEQGFNPDAFAPTFKFLDRLAAASADPASVSWRGALDPASPWWFLIDRMLSPESHTALIFVKPEPAFQTAAAASALETAIRKSDVPVFVTGWTQTLGTLVPWAKRELFTFGGAVLAVIVAVLAFVYRDWRAWTAHTLGLAFSIAATIATLKLLALQINLLNVLAFPLMLAVGVDYGIHLLLAARSGGEHIASVTKPVLISGLTTVTGFGSLVLASNPSLSGLGAVCSIGVAWSLATSFLFVLPLASQLQRPRNGSDRKTA